MRCKALVVEEMQDEAADIRLQPSQQEVLGAFSMLSQLLIGTGMGMVAFVRGV